MSVVGYGIGGALGMGTESTPGTAVAPSIILSAPTGSATAGGTLTAGAYHYKVATVYNRTATGDKYVAPASASVTITTATTDLTATLAFTDPTTLTPPDGWTVAGTAIYRSAAGGSANTETFLAYQSGTAAGYADDGSITPDTTVLPVSATMYRQGTRGRRLRTAPARQVSADSAGRLR